MKKIYCGSMITNDAYATKLKKMLMDIDGHKMSQIMIEEDSQDWDSSKFFTSKEFKCPCCGKVNVSMSLLLRLNLARSLTKTRFYLTSGYRCTRHNKDVGGVASSSHIRGHAIDIRVSNSSQRYEILRVLILAGFTRIGIGKDFIHVDDDTTKPPDVVWLY